MHCACADLFAASALAGAAAQMAKKDTAGAMGGAAEAAEARLRPAEKELIGAANDENDALLAPPVADAIALPARCCAVLLTGRRAWRSCCNVKPPRE
jgi:hypothetical protein